MPFKLANAIRVIAVIAATIVNLQAQPSAAQCWWCGECNVGGPGAPFFVPCCTLEAVGYRHCVLNEQSCAQWGDCTEV